MKRLRITSVIVTCCLLCALLLGVYRRTVTATSSALTLAIVNMFDRQLSFLSSGEDVYAIRDDRFDGLPVGHYMLHLDQDGMMIYTEAGAESTPLMIITGQNLPEEYSSIDIPVEVVSGV